MSSGFRRSEIRHGARTIAALIAIFAVGQGQLVSTSSTVSQAIAARSTIAVPAGAPARQAAAARTTPGAATAALADTVAFDDSQGQDDPLDAAAAGDAAGLEPSIQYEEAERHASDKIAFTPGERVTVPFQPRAGDRWTVGDVAPTTLPAGRLDGRTIRGQGAAPARDELNPPRPRGRRIPTATETSIDVPSGGPALIAATAASFNGEAGSATDTQTITPDAAVSPNGLRREVFGFLPYWEVNSSSLRLDYSKISTIAYFGVGVDGTGHLQKRNNDGSTTVGWSGWTSSKMTSIISAAHARHTRVVLTVQSFGWNTSGLNRQKALLGSATHRLTLARQIAAAVRDRGADGVNLDFEPLAATYDAEFTALVRSIRAELNKVHRGYQITFDTTGRIGNYPIAKATAPGGADAIFIMGYDYRSGGSSPVGSVAPLGRTGYDIRDTILAYRAKVPASKLILGVPYYGRAWSTASGALHASNTSSTKTGASTTIVYDTAADYLAKYGRHYDAGEGVAWTAYKRENCTAKYGCVTSWRELYVDDATALGAKYDLVNTYGLRGAGIWALGYDGTRPELWSAIQRKFVTDTTPPTAGVRVLAGRQINPGFTVTWTGRDDVAVKSYDVQVSTDHGAWTAWLSGTTAASAVWFGMDGHGYAFRVRARDLKGNLSAWNVTANFASADSLKVGGFGLVRVDGLSVRSAADTAATKIGTFDSGDVVAIVGGPRSADGYTWYRVAGPLREWGAVTSVAETGWVAASGAGTTRLSPVKAPNATTIGAALGHLAFGNAGPGSVGSAANATAHRALSPNGDHSGDTLPIDWTNDRAFDSLSLRVWRADGRLVGDIAIPKLTAGPHQVDWNGRVGGALQPNGRYLVSLVGRDAGATFYNPTTTFRTGSLASYGVTIDTVFPVVASASSSSTLMSPNSDGIRDSVTVKLRATGATSWAFSAAPLSGSTVGAAVATRAGAGGSASVTWTGRTNAGAVVRDGLYRLTLAAADNAGNRRARAWTVRVDNTRASLAATATPVSFSPNGDGAADTSRLGWSASERITGSARVYHGTTLIRSWTVTAATTGAVRWNGTSAAGRAVPDGHYLFRISGRDAAGNGAILAIPVTVDRTLSSIRWSKSSFYPQDGDAIARSSRLTFSLKRTATVTVGVYSGTKLIRTVWTNRRMAAGSWGWSWDGRNAAGIMVAPGSYVARITAASSLGTSVLTRAVAADAFSVRLSATAVRAGQKLIVTLTSTEPLRAAPTVSFAQPGRAAVKRTATSLGSGRYRVTFTIGSATAGIGTIWIAGRDKAGGLNVTTRSVTIR